MNHWSRPHVCRRRVDHSRFRNARQIGSRWYDSDSDKRMGTKECSATRQVRAINQSEQSVGRPSNQSGWGSQMGQTSLHQRCLTHLIALDPFDCSLAGRTFALTASTGVVLASKRPWAVAAIKPLVHQFFRRGASELGPSEELLGLPEAITNSIAQSLGSTMSSSSQTS